MPSRIVEELIDRVAKMEARVENLLTWQKWEMGILAAILIAILVKRV